MGLPKTGEERRTHTRYAKNITIQINNRSRALSGRLEHDSFNQASEIAKGKDISEGGLCFYSAASYEVGAVLGLIIRIADLDQIKRRLPMYLAVSSIPIAAEGEVVRCTINSGGSGYEVGIRFVDIYEDDYRILMKHLGE
ncbi:MAG: PilZ domain-containing protein [Desulfatibacillum sp.]|nr:PilZ domain-containing protein [Desulfatibacillum sp.]